MISLQIRIFLFMGFAALHSQLSHAQNARPIRLDLDKLVKTTTKNAERSKLNPVVTQPQASLLGRPYSVTIAELAEAGGPTYLLTPDTVGHSFSLWNQSESKAWQKAQYLVLDLYNPNRYTTNVIIGFYRQSADGKGIERACAASVGIFPQLRTKMVVPLSYLDCQQIYLPRYPRQGKGRILGQSIKPTDLVDVRLELEPYVKPFFASKLYLKGLELQTVIKTDLPALTAPYIDALGQLNHKTWGCKIPGEYELGYYHRKLDTTYSNSGLNLGRTENGALKSLKMNGTGWFRVENIGGKRWWLIDPEGFAFLSTGVTGVRPGEGAMVTGFEELYKELPTGLDTVNYTYHQKVNKLFSFTANNYRKTFGKKDWRMVWNRITKNMMAQWRFNTVANWSDTGFIRYANMPYVMPLRKFPTTSKKLYRDFPDVFDPSYPDSCAKFAMQLEPHKSDRNMIGYFLNNEPEWAFGDNNLALKMLQTKNGPNHTRRELRNDLINQYRGNVKQFNTAWGLKLKSFEQLDSVVLPSDVKLTPEAMAYLSNWSNTMVDKYLKPVCDAVKLVDPHHLNLGIRYAYISNDLCYRAGQYFDIFSINGYNAPYPPETAEITKRTGKPVMIGEFHFGALDQGHTATGIRGVYNQKQRGIAYQTYVEQGFARPEVVGIHYFQWNDQPVGGRFDGENYNIGLVDVCGFPYKDFVHYVSDANTRVYDVARRLYPPANLKAKTVPDIY